MRTTRERIIHFVLLLAAIALAALSTACGESNSQSEGPQQDEATQTDNAATNDGSASKSEDVKAGNAGNSEASSSGKPYQVSCDGETCRANQAVVAGFDKYHAHCHTCHGPNGVGSTFAPSLVKRLDGMGQGEFTGIVANGKKRFDSTTGTYSVMPAWKDNPEVMRNVANLWAYLKARADDALPAVHPKPLE